MQSSITVRGATIALDDSGDGPVILLLHGFPSTHRLWAEIRPAMAEMGFRTLAPDLVGYGASRPHAEEHVDMASQARWMLALLDSLEVQSAIVLAHDVGSAAAQLMLTMAPERVRGLCLVDGAYAREWAMDSIAGIVAWNPADAHRLHPVLMRRLGKNEGMRSMLAAYEGEEGGRRLIRAARDLDPEQTADLDAALRAAGKPAIVIWGDADRFLPIDTVARPLAEVLGAPLVIVPGGHFSPLDCPDEMISALRPFLEGLLKQGAAARSR